MKTFLTVATLVAAIVLCERGSNAFPDSSDKEKETETMKLGAFSISLAVKDLPASRDFYGKLGFKPAGGNAEQNWLILRNGDGHTIGLFQGMFKQNIMTFNPGWGRNAQNLDEFMDIRDIQKHLKAEGIVLTTEADEETEGPASLTMLDPDGNPILVDQHR